MLNRGAGFRQFVDIACYTKNAQLTDWNWIKNKLDEIGLLEFAETVCQLNQYWFGISNPFNDKNLDVTFVYESTELLFKNGIFGFENVETAKQLNTIKARKLSKNRIVAKFYMIHGTMKIIFLNYQSIKEISYCSFVDGRPWLLPVAWIVRFFYKVKSKSIESGIEHIKRTHISNENLTELDKFLKQWGLSEKI